MPRGRGRLRLAATGGMALPPPPPDPRILRAHVRDKAALDWFMTFDAVREQLSNLLAEGEDLPVLYQPQLGPQMMFIELSNGRLLMLSGKKDRRG